MPDRYASKSGTGVRMKKLIVWGAILGSALYFGTKFYLHYRVSSNLDNALLMLSPFAQVSYSGVSSTMGGTLSVDDLVVQVNGYRDPVRADKLSLVTPGFWHLLALSDIGPQSLSKEMPESLGFAIVGFQSDVDSDLMRTLYRLGKTEKSGGEPVTAAETCTGRFGFSPDDLEDLGYTSLEADLHFGYRKDGADIVVDARSSIVDMYEMNLEMTLDGAMSPQAVAMGTYRPKLIDARLEYVDQSLDRRTTKLCERAGLSAEEVLAAKLEAFLSIGEDQGIVFDEQIVKPYREFLGGKSTFVLEAQPHEPVTMSQIGLYKPSDVPALLNLTASTY